MTNTDQKQSDFGYMFRECLRSASRFRANFWGDGSPQHDFLKSIQLMYGLRENPSFTGYPNEPITPLADALGIQNENATVLRLSDTVAQTYDMNRGLLKDAIIVPGLRELVKPGLLTDIAFSTRQKIKRFADSQYADIPKEDRNSQLDSLAGDLFLIGSTLPHVSLRDEDKDKNIALNFAFFDPIKYAEQAKRNRMRFPKVEDCVLEAIQLIRANASDRIERFQRAVEAYN
jgi:hypothetical protein